MSGRERLSRVRTIKGVESKQTSLERLESWAKIISAIAIPVVLAIMAWWVQSSVATEGIKKDYVSMAIAILKDDKVADADLKTWAVAIVEKNSPVPLSNELRSKIVMGALQSVPISVTWFPPKSLMEPPIEPKEFPFQKIKAGQLTAQELAVGWAQAQSDAKTNAITIRYFQKWVNMMQKSDEEFKHRQLEKAKDRIVNDGVVSGVK